MPQVKTSELKDIALDWAVTLIEKPEACEYGVEDWRNQRLHTVKDGEYLYRWHQSWMQAGPIIDREKIAIRPYEHETQKWSAEQPLIALQRRQSSFSTGHSALTAAMRCYVASKLGDTVEIPEELL